MSKNFYDAAAPYYHLIHGDWEENIETQSASLDQIIRRRWGNGTRRVLDATCSIGTQALGLAAKYGNGAGRVMYMIFLCISRRTMVLTS